MKALKLVGKIILGLLIVLVIALLAIPLWIGPVAKCAANKIVPGITGTGFNLGEFGLNPYSGKVHVGDMQLANPTNFSEKNAVDLSALDIDIAMGSLFCGKKYRINSIDLDGLVVYSDATAENFRTIAANAAGEPKEDETPAVTQLAEESGTPAAGETDAAQAQGEKPGKGIEIDRITLKNITIKYALATIKVPMDIELTDLGKDTEGGMDPEAAWTTIYDKVLSSVGVVGGKLSDLGKGAIDAVSSAVDVEGTKAALKDAHEGLKDAVRNVDLDGAKDAFKGAGDALKDAGAGLKDLFK